MGKRGRREAAARPQVAKPAGKQSVRERIDRASRIAERELKARPAAPWDPFPLTELAVFLGLVLLIAGLVVQGSTGKGLIAAGVVLACIGGLETALREHIGGYRSHAGLLSGIVALATLIVTTAVFHIGVPVRAAIAIGIFAILFPVLRSDFIRRSGGRGVV